MIEMWNFQICTFKRLLLQATILHTVDRDVYTAHNKNQLITKQLIKWFAVGEPCRELLELQSFVYWSEAEVLWELAVSHDCVEIP